MFYFFSCKSFGYEVRRNGKSRVGRNKAWTWDWRFKYVQIIVAPLLLTTKRNKNISNRSYVQCQQSLRVGSGCGIVGWVVAFNIGGLRFKSNQWQIFVKTICLLFTVNCGIKKSLRVHILFQSQVDSTITYCDYYNEAWVNY